MLNKLGSVRILTVSLAVVLSILALKFLRPPYPWIALVWVGIALLEAIVAKSGSSYRVVCVNAAVVVLALGIFETYVWKKTTTSPIERQREMTKAYRLPHDVLGYAPVARNVIHDRGYFRGVPVFNGVYTIDEKGLRKTPMHEGKGGCLLFFGGSFTFGHGVKDEEAMPYVVAESVGREYGVFNFGFSGYGPHQMLSALQAGLVEDKVQCDVVHVIYQGIFDHWRRVAGMGLHDTHGPRYELLADRSLVRRGNFDDNSSFAQWLSNQLQKSFTYRLLAHRVTNETLDLLVAITVEAQREVRNRFPHSDFHMIYWDSRTSSEEMYLLRELESQGIQVHRVSDILGDLEDPAWKLHEADGHPTPLAHAKIANYIVRVVLRKQPINPATD